MNTKILYVLCIVILDAATSATANAVAVSGQGTWQTTLIPRSLNGDPHTAQAYYDTTLNITWLADANYAYTTGYAPDSGLMSWAAANTWAANLNIDGVTGWRLPDTNPINGSTYNYNWSDNGSTDVGVNMSAPGTVYADSTGSEMANLFYDTLGNLGAYDTSGAIQPSAGLTNTGPFSNVQDGAYWAATPFAPNSNDAWYFSMPNGDQYGNLKTGGLPAWAVHTGDVGTSVIPLPVPATVWLFGSGLLGLIGAGTKRRG